MTDNRRCRDCNVSFAPTTDRHKRCPRCQTKVTLVTCKDCQTEFSPLHGSQRKCETCRDGLTQVCRYCGSAASAERCTDCINLGKPGYDQCPYSYCLEVYKWDPKSPHKCGPGRKTQTERLAAVHRRPDLLVLAGPPVPARATGVRNKPVGSETLDEAIAWDKANGYANDHKNVRIAA